MLRHQPSFVSEGLTVGCLEGVLQVPGTVFTIRVVWPDNPNDVIASSTFTLDASTTIGGPGQTTLLSDAINNGGLLDETIAATNTIQELDVSALPVGVFLLAVRQDNGLPMVKKFVLSH